MRNMLTNVGLALGIALGGYGASYFSDNFTEAEAIMAEHRQAAESVAYESDKLADLEKIHDNASESLRLLRPYNSLEVVAGLAYQQPRTPEDELFVGIDMTLDALQQWGGEAVHAQELKVERLNIEHEQELDSFYDAARNTSKYTGGVCGSLALLIICAGSLVVRGYEALRGDEE